MAQSFYPTSTTVIDAAIRLCDGYDPESGVMPTTIERQRALEALNFLVTSWMADGLQVWCQKTGIATLTASDGSITLGPSGADVTIARPLSVQQAWLRDTTTSPPLDIPMFPLSREDYNLLSSKTTTGTPNAYFYDPTYDLPASNSGANAFGTMSIWPVPDASVATQYDMYFVYTRPIQDFSAVGDGIDFPQEWYNCIKWNLAKQIGPEYDVPVDRWDRIVKEADDSKALALSWDSEKTSLEISPANKYNQK